MSTGANEGASVVNAYEGRKASEKAKKAEEEANFKAEQWQTKVYNENRALLAPYQEAGTKSLATIQDLQGYNGPEARNAAMEAFRTDPGYQFSVNQANKGMERSALKAGNMYSGNFADALGRQNIGMADQQYGNYYNRLWNTANMGRGTATGVANMSTQYGGAMGGLAQNAGQIQSQNFWNQYNLEANARNTIAQGQQYTFDKAGNTASSVAGTAVGAYFGGAGGAAAKAGSGGGGGGYRNPYGRPEDGSSGNYQLWDDSYKRYGQDYSAWNNSGY